MQKSSTAVGLLVILLLLQSCLKDTLTHTYTILTPVYKSKNEVYAGIRSNAPREINSPGKFFIIGHYIFLNEIDKGIHIIDNSDPAKPVKEAFIDIPGNLDIAVKGNTLYADLYSDLVVIDISDPLHVKFIKYISNIFPERNYSNGFVADSSRIIVDWIKKDTTVNISSPSGQNFYGYLFAPASFSSNAAAPAIPGISGSTSRFNIINDYLYAVNSYSLTAFDISATNDPQKLSSNNVGWSIETIYSFKDKLFLGSSSGVFIYDISNPSSPVNLGQFSHARSCDPVIVDGDIAYVTLHDGTPCGGYSNEMDVINVSTLASPFLVRTYSTTNPHGLTKDNNQLFVCDGKGGLREYDASDPAHVILKETISGIETFDAIAWNKNLVVVAKDGLYQYDYTTPGKLVQKSKLPVNL
jgi:hypothetical protein